MGLGVIFKGVRGHILGGLSYGSYFKGQDRGKGEEDSYGIKWYNNINEHK